MSRAPASCWSNWWQASRSLLLRAACWRHCSCSRAARIGSSSPGSGCRAGVERWDHEDDDLLPQRASRASAPQRISTLTARLQPHQRIARCAPSSRRRSWKMASLQWPWIRWVHSSRDDRIPWRLVRACSRLLNRQRYRGQPVVDQLLSTRQGLTCRCCWRRPMPRPGEQQNVAVSRLLERAAHLPPQIRKCRLRRASLYVCGPQVWRCESHSGSTCCSASPATRGATGLGPRGGSRRAMWSGRAPS